MAALAGIAAAHQGDRKAVLDPSASVVRPVRTWTLTYTVGPSGIATNGGLRLGFSSFPQRVFQTPQVDDPKAPNYVTASASREGVELEVDVRKELRGGWMQMENVAVTVAEGRLLEGDTIAVVLGDTTRGSLGGRLQRGVELNAVEVTTLVDSEGDGEFERVAEQPTLDIVGESAVRLDVFAPSMVVAGEPFEIAVVAKDRTNNVAMDFGGTVQVTCPHQPGFRPISVAFPEAGPAAKRVEAKLSGEGVRTFHAESPRNVETMKRVPASAFITCPTPREDQGFHR